MNVLHYNSWEMFLNPANKHKLEQIPGGENYSKFFPLFGGNFCMSDRTNNIITPMKTEIFDFCRMPTYTKEYKECFVCCDERAVQLMEFAKNTNRKIAVMYSGGIDSTLVLSAFFKNCSEADVKKHLVALVNHTSISENPRFFLDHIIKNIECIPSYKYGDIAGNDSYMLISGEQADQLFTVAFATNFGQETKLSYLNDTIEQRLDETLAFIGRRVGESNAQHVLNTLREVTNKAPIDVSAIKDFWWWISFTLMWQANYLRILPFIKNIKGIKFEENYTTFFNTNDFQLWAMNNRDFDIGSNLNYKIVFRDYIYDYNKDLEYRNGKRKNGSLSSAIKRKVPYTWIDNEHNGYYDFPTIEYYNNQNSFI